MTFEELDRQLREYQPKELLGRQAYEYAQGGVNIETDYRNRLDYLFQVNGIRREHEQTGGLEFGSADEFEWQTGSFHLKQHLRYLPTPLHTHNFIEMTYVYSGSCRQTINGRELEMRAGDLCILDMNTEHSIHMTRDEDIVIVLMMRPTFFRMRFFLNLWAKMSCSRISFCALSGEGRASAAICCSTGRRTVFRIPCR